MAEVLTNAIIVIAVTSMLGYLSSSALRSKPHINAAAGTRTFAYVRPYKFLAVVSLLPPALAGALALHLFRTGQSDFTIWVIVSLVFAAMSVYMLLECFRVRVVVTESSIISLSPWTGRREVQWPEVRSIAYSQTSMWHVISGPGGEKIRASDYLAGVAELVAELKRRVPPERWEGMNEKPVRVAGGRI